MRFDSKLSRARTATRTSTLPASNYYFAPFEVVRIISFAPFRRRSPFSSSGRSRRRNWLAKERTGQRSGARVLTLAEQKLHHNNNESDNYLSYIIALLVAGFNGYNLLAVLRSALMSCYAFRFRLFLRRKRANAHCWDEPIGSPCAAAERGNACEEKGERGRAAGQSETKNRENTFLYVNEVAQFRHVFVHVTIALLIAARSCH